MADCDAGCRVRSTSTKCPTKKSRTSSSPPISRRENASVSRRHSRRSSKSLAKTCSDQAPIGPLEPLFANLGENVIANRVGGDIFKTTSAMVAGAIVKKSTDRMRLQI